MLAYSVKAFLSFSRNEPLETKNPFETSTSYPYKFTEWGSEVGMILVGMNRSVVQQNSFFF